MTWASVMTTSNICMNTHEHTREYNNYLIYIDEFVCWMSRLALGPPGPDGPNWPNGPNGPSGPTGPTDGRMEG